MLEPIKLFVDILGFPAHGHRRNRAMLRSVPANSLLAMPEICLVRFAQMAWMWPPPRQRVIATAF